MHLVHLTVALQVGEEDFNDDQVPDMITFTASVQGDMPIHGVKALLQFTYSFDVSGLQQLNIKDVPPHLVSGSTAR